MNTKIIAGFLIGATALAASLSAPADARRHHGNWNQFYGQNAYFANPYGNRGYQRGAYGLNQNNPSYFRQAQQAQWAQSQGGGNGFGHGYGHGH